MGQEKGLIPVQGFKLPNGSERLPEIAWVKLDRWNTLTPEQQKTFPPIAPDCVIELRSETDALTNALQPIYLRQSKAGFETHYR